MATQQYVAVRVAKGTEDAAAKASYLISYLYLLFLISACAVTGSLKNAYNHSVYQEICLDYKEKLGR